MSKSIWKNDLYLKYYKQYQYYKKRLNKTFSDEFKYGKAPNSVKAIKVKIKHMQMMWKHGFNVAKAKTFRDMTAQAVRKAMNNGYVEREIGRFVLRQLNKMSLKDFNKFYNWRNKQYEDETTNRNSIWSLQDYYLGNDEKGAYRSNPANLTTYNLAKDLAKFNDVPNENIPFRVYLE